MVENSPVKIDYKVMEYQGDHGKHCLVGPEVIHIKALKGITLFDILDHMLIIGTGELVSPDFLWCGA